MQILTSALQLGAQHQSTQRHEVREELRVWRAPAPAPAPAAHAESPEQDNLCASATPADLDLVVLQMLIERLTGRKMKLADVAGLMDATVSTSDQVAAVSTRPDWSATYDREEIRAESEQMQFAAAGLVRTADGREIRIAVALTMSREFVERTGLHLRAGAAALKDPLVLNFEGTAAQLTDRQFSFDLDADGSREEVPLLAATSAYLALDRNEDGVINDGRELFGPASGNGFTELSAYDMDHNGWIDEADPVFSRLKLWFPGMEQGATASLAERGIGALSLGSVESPFDLKRAEELAGQVRSTGIYLNEDGTAGTLQQVDLKA